MNALDRSLSVSGIGLCLAGWASLISGSMMEPGSLLIAGRSISQRDVMVLGQSALITGCMLIFAASMRNGFGALDRFFNAALERANRAAALRMGDGEAGDVMAGTRSAPVFMPTAVPVSIDGRNCMRLADGGVVVETLLGARRFNSEGEARQFMALLPKDGALSNRPAHPLNA